MNKILLLDGMNLFHRSLWSYRDLVGPDGISIGPTFGFVSMLISLANKYKTGNILIAWEGKNNWRKGEYKANRKSREFTDEEKMIYKHNKEAVKCILDCMPIVQLQNKRLEADDIIFYVVHRLKEKISKLGSSITIVSNDKDYMQLVVDRLGVTIARPDKGEYQLFAEVDVKDKYGISPRYMGIFLALAGDAGDNVKGVPGIGPVKAKQIIAEIDNAKSISKGISKCLTGIQVNQFLESYRMVVMDKNLVKIIDKHSKYFVKSFGSRKAIALQEILYSHRIQKYSAAGIFSAIGDEYSGFHKLIAKHI